MEIAPIVEYAIARRIFPGAVVYLAHEENLLAHRAFGTTAYDAEYSTPVTTDTIYDVASLTKLLVATAFMMAARESGIAVHLPLAHFLPEFSVADKREITLRDLLQHASGIEIAIQSLAENSPDKWIARVAQAPLQAAPRTRVLYSCTNYFLLARVLEKIGVPLDEYISKRLLAPLGMTRTSFEPLQEYSLDVIAPTEIVNGELQHGTVNDRAARAWQEYSGRADCGNAGLFSTAADLAKFARLWLDGGAFAGRQIIEREDVENALGDVLPEDEPSTLRRGWCWQLDAPFYMSDKAPPNSCGHTGFTGPTLWLNRQTRHLCIVLNNRVHPDANGPVRFPIHRRIARRLLAQTLLAQTLLAQTTQVEDRR